MTTTRTTKGRIERAEIRTVDDMRTWWCDVFVRINHHGKDVTGPSVLALAGQVILQSDPGTPLIGWRRVFDDGSEPTRWLNAVWFVRNGQQYRASYDHDTGTPTIRRIISRVEIKEEAA